MFYYKTIKPCLGNIIVPSRDRFKNDFFSGLTKTHFQCNIHYKLPLLSVEHHVWIHLVIQGEDKIPCSLTVDMTLDQIFWRHPQLLAKQKTRSVLRRFYIVLRKWRNQKSCWSPTIFFCFSIRMVFLFKLNDNSRKKELKQSKEFYWFLCGLLWSHISSKQLFQKFLLSLRLRGCWNFKIKMHGTAKPQSTLIKWCIFWSRRCRFYTQEQLTWFLGFLKHK